MDTKNDQKQLNLKQQKKLHQFTTRTSD
jgi:hypothetical protein